MYKYAYIIMYLCIYIYCIHVCITFINRSSSSSLVGVLSVILSLVCWKYSHTYLYIYIYIYIYIYMRQGGGVMIRTGTFSASRKRRLVDFSGREGTRLLKPCYTISKLGPFLHCLLIGCFLRYHVNRLQI